MKKVAIIQARMGSSRFPNKVMAKLKGKPLIQWIVEAARKITGIDEVIVATSVAEQDKIIVKWCEENNTVFFAGSENDVLSRYYFAAKEAKADVIMRLTADCPLLDCNIASAVLSLQDYTNADYSSNVLPPTWPDGMDCEVFKFKALELAYNESKRDSDREHVTPFIRNNQSLFSIENFVCSIPHLSSLRFTVDHPEDLEYLNQILNHLEGDITLWNILRTLKIHTTIKRASIRRNEGFEISLKKEMHNITRFQKSEELLKRALKTVPLASQTFSKSYLQHPLGKAPLFLTHGQGAFVWDVDGNQYLDMVSGLLSVSLGYNDPDVNNAITKQLNCGISFSLATELEYKLAELLVKHIPSAEKVRFGKNGTDVTSAAVRLARAYTRRDKVLVCGYHGWQDWYIASTTRSLGVPNEVKKLTDTVPYNNLEALESLLKTEAYSAFIMEPANIEAPNKGYLEGVRSLTKKYGTVLVFDEIITGFHFDLGGAQKYFGITPDLSCFGKGLGNGMPISAIVGKAEIMDLMNDIFFSGTFGGEALSLAAGIAVIEKMEEQKVIEHLWKFGESVAFEMQEIISEHELDNVIKLMGYAPWKIFSFHAAHGIDANAIRTFFQKEMAKEGVLILSSHNINYAMQDFEKHTLISAYKATLKKLAYHIKKGDLISVLECPVIQPIFKVR